MSSKSSRRVRHVLLCWPNCVYQWIIHFTWRLLSHVSLDAAVVVIQQNRLSKQQSYSRTGGLGNHPLSSGCYKYEARAGTPTFFSQPTTQQAPAQLHCHNILSSLQYHNQPPTAPTLPLNHHVGSRKADDTSAAPLPHHPAGQLC